MSNIEVSLTDGYIFAVGDYGTYLRIRGDFTDSSFHEVVGGQLVPGYTELLDAAVNFARNNWVPAAANKVLLGQAFLRGRVATIPEMAAVMRSLGIGAKLPAAIELRNAAFAHMQLRLTAKVR